MFTNLICRAVQHGPQMLRLPLSVTPFRLQASLLQQLLNWQFQDALQQGEIDFLQGRKLGIRLRDVPFSWVTTLHQGKLQIDSGNEADVWFSGHVNDLICIAARKADPDTLFFQRRLLIEGDTELGLEVKNMMDAIDLHAMPAPLRMAILQLAGFIETASSEDANAGLARAGNSC